MLNGVHLTLMIGPAVPVPVPQAVLDALVSVSVTTTAAPRTPSGFELKFTLSTKSPLHTMFLLSGGAQLPIMRVILIATVGATAETLIDGVITKQQVQPGPDAGHSILTITGVDLTAVMDLIDFDGLPYPAMPAEARVALILAKYAFLGIIPLVIPSLMLFVPIPTEQIPRQQGKDLPYLHDLAEAAGYVFYLEPGPAPGTTIAYWGPEVKVGVPQPALNVDMDAYTNVESLSFNFDTESAVLPVVYIQNQETGVPIPIPIPGITPLNPPLGIIPPIPKKINFMQDTAKLSPIEAVLKGLAEASKTADAVTGQGSLDVLRYGRILKARQLVGVRGAGPAFDGLHYVKSVTHNIKPGEYKQSFTLTRNGLLSTVSSVPA